jgi:hypothetical protein
MKSPARWFLLGCLFEALLGGAGVGGNLALARPPLADFGWVFRDAGAGLAAVGPLLALFLWMLRTRQPALARIRAVLEAVIRPALGRASLAQLAVLAALAGLGEEAFFRGLMQGALAGWLGPVPALLLASLAFGLCHCLTRAYAVLATLVGVYLGGLWMLTGNLLAPALAHGVYDFAALVIFLRVHRPSPAVGTDAAD